MNFQNGHLKKQKSPIFCRLLFNEILLTPQYAKQEHPISLRESGSFSFCNSLLELNALSSIWTRELGRVNIVMLQPIKVHSLITLTIPRDWICVRLAQP